MKESEENEIVIENTNTNKNNSNEKNEGVLDKIRILKSENYKIEKKNIALIKSSPNNLCVKVINA